MVQLLHQQLIDFLTQPIGCSSVIFQGFMLTNRPTLGTSTTGKQETFCEGGACQFQLFSQALQMPAMAARESNRARPRAIY